MSNRFDNTKVAFELKSDRELQKAYWLFTFIEYPWLIKAGSTLVIQMISLKWVQTVIKQTFFWQFCAGETKEESLRVVDRLNSKKVKSILDYSIEGKTNETSFDNTFDEVLANIELADHTEGIPFVIFKPTGVGRLDLYEKVSLGLTLTEEETQEWKRVVHRYEIIAQKASDLEIKVMIDAEESWAQNAVDDLIDDLMSRYNKSKCIISSTLQMYRHDRLTYLQEAYKRAKEGNYLLGFKIVRGAYMEKERARALEKGYPSPINPTKEATDALYNEAVVFILDRIERMLLFAGTHNEYSSALIIDFMQQKNLPLDHPHIWLGQLYGMSDNISFNASRKGYNVCKYLPYGPVGDVMPYLVRRSEENTSIKGQSGRELLLIKKELERRRHAAS